MRALDQWPLTTMLWATSPWRPRQSRGSGERCPRPSPSGAGLTSSTLTFSLALVSNNWIPTCPGELVGVFGLHHTLRSGSSSYSPLEGKAESARPHLRPAPAHWPPCPRPRPPAHWATRASTPGSGTAITVLVDFMKPPSTLTTADSALVTSTTMTPWVLANTCGPGSRQTYGE